uniref:Uncharacterized protein n=1 Tax=Romanomermis culicivorax TaxID=13658 RepID=A0A915JWH7_ROMCU
MLTVVETVGVTAVTEVTVVEGGGTEAIVGNGAIIVVAVSDFVVVRCSTSIGGAGETLFANKIFDDVDEYEGGQGISFEEVKAATTNAKKNKSWMMTSMEKP